MTTGRARVDAILDDLDQFGGKLGLEAITRLLEALSNPQDEVPSVLVAGTNGKGSTSALLAAMGHAAGYRTGLYTSPHLERPEERIRLDGRVIASQVLADLLEEVVDCNRALFGVRPSYFEAMTAAARLHFARCGVELAVIEVGLGGRLDATNVGTPLVAVVTPVSLDHQAQLGKTLESISAEKAGIFRPRVPVVAWCEPDAVGATLRRRAEALDAPMIDASRVARVRARGPIDAPPVSLEVETPAGSYLLEVQLLGRHQFPNISLAVLVAETLRELGFSRLDRAAVERGAERCRWPGRLEDVQPPGGPPVLLDGAHNEAGAGVLAAMLDGSPRETVLLFGCLATKEVGRILPPLAERAARVILTVPLGGTAHEPDSLRDLLERRGTTTRVEVEVETELDRALDRALECAASLPRHDGPGGRVLVAGSLYLVGDVRRLLYRRFGVPLPAVEIETG